MQANQVNRVQALGGRGGDSAVVRVERERLARLCAEMREVGVINSNERALRLRRVLVENNPALAGVFRSCGYSL